MHSSGADSFVTSCALRCSVKSHSQTSLMVWHGVKRQYLLFPWQPWWCLIHFVSGVLKCTGWLETKDGKTLISTFTSDYIWRAKSVRVQRSSLLTDVAFLSTLCCLSTGFSFTTLLSLVIPMTSKLNLSLFASTGSTLRHTASPPIGWLHRRQSHPSSLPLLSLHIRWVDALWSLLR